VFLQLLHPPGFAALISGEKLKSSMAQPAATSPVLDPKILFGKLSSKPQEVFLLLLFFY
jgi:hypothetical protein